MTSNSNSNILNLISKSKTCKHCYSQPHIRILSRIPIICEFQWWSRLRTRHFCSDPRFLKSYLKDDRSVDAGYDSSELLEMMDEWSVGGTLLLSLHISHCNIVPVPPTLSNWAGVPRFRDSKQFLRPAVLSLFHFVLYSSTI